MRRKNVKNRIPACIILLALLVNLFGAPITVSAEDEKATFFVAADAEAGGDGSFEHPFQTPEQARDAIRALKKKNAYPTEGVTVYLRGGEYRQTFSLGAEDSGTEEGPVTYSGYGDEEVIFVGGAQLTLSDFKVSSDSRIPAEAQGKVFSVNLNEKKIKGYGDLAITGHSQYYMWEYGWEEKSEGVPNPFVSFDGELMNLAQYPNKGDGYMLIGQVLFDGVMENKKENPNAINEGAEFVVNDGHYERWASAEDPWLFSWFKYDWSDLQIGFTVKPENRSIKMDKASVYEPVEGRNFYVLNILEELDARGEWFYDKNSGELFIYPFNTDPDARVSIGFGNETMLKIDGAEHIIIKNMEFQGTRAYGISVTNSNNIDIRYCVIKNTSKEGVTFSSTVYDSRVLGCRIYNQGQSGAVIAGGSVEEGRKGNNFIEDCIINNVAIMVRTYKPNVRLQGYGNGVINSLLYDSPCAAVIWEGNDIIIENNEIHSVQTEGTDAGALYAGQQMNAWGTSIKGNLIHDYGAQDNRVTTHGVDGVYLDGWFSGATITENIIYNDGAIGGNAIFIHGGVNNTITNNIIANTKNGVHVAGVYDGAPGNMSDIFSAAAMERIKHPAYVETYGEKFKIMVEENKADPRWNVADKNLCFNVKNPSTFDIGNRPITTDWFFENNDLHAPYATSVDPGFISVENDIYFLKDVASIQEQIPGFAFNLKPEDVGVSTPHLVNMLKDDAVALRIGEPRAYVKWQSKMIDEDNYKMAPFIENDFTYVPLRFFAESIGAEVDFDGEAAVIQYNNAEMRIKPGSSEIMLNGEPFAVEAVPMIRGDRIFVPLRACGELFNKNVLWDDSGLIIISNEDLSNAFTARELKAMADRI